MGEHTVCQCSLPGIETFSELSGQENDITMHFSGAAIVAFSRFCIRKKLNFVILFVKKSFVRRLAAPAGSSLRKAARKEDPLLSCPQGMF